MMDLVFKSEKGTPVTNSLLVAEKFEKNHQHVMEAIRKLMTVENSTVLKMFYESSYINSQNKKQPMFVMNRDGFSLLVMGFTGKQALNFKIDFINAFNKMEANLKNKSFAIPQTYSEALELAAHQAREIEAKDKQLAIQAPMVSFVNRAIDSGSLTDIGQAAKLLKLKYGRNTFFKVLRDSGIFFKNRNEPKQEFIERGYFELRETEITRDNHPPMMVTNTLVTQAGLFWLSKKFNGAENISIPTLKTI